MYTKKIFFLLFAALVALTQGLQAQNPCNLNVQIAPPASLSCQNPSVQLEATVTPPGNYTYQWFGPQSVPNTPNPTVSTPGWYALSVSDSLNNCWGGDTVAVTQDGSLPVVTITGTVAGCTGTAVLTASAIGQGPFAYAWSSGETTPTVEVSGSGVATYCVTVTNTSAGCSGVQCYTVAFGNTLTVEIDYYDSPFCNDSLGMWVNVQGGTPPYTYLWNSGITSPWIQDPVSGTYVVTVTDAAGCSVVASQFIENDPDECGHLEGFVLADWNTNCTKEPSDEGLSQVRLRLQNASGQISYAFSDASGHYSIEVLPGTYTVEVIPASALWQPCQSSVSVTLAPNQFVTRDFLLKPLAICPAMSVDIAIPFLRRCFTNTYHVAYCNNGTAAPPNAYVEILFDPLMTVIQASVAFTDLGNHLYRFDIGTVPIGFCGDFWVTTVDGCSSAIGQTLCAEAIIFPTGNCEPANAQWSGASLQLEAACNADTLDFVVKNAGTGTMSAPLEYVIIEDAVMIMQAPPPAVFLAPSEEYHIKVPANGSTWRVEIEQEAFHPGLSKPALAVEGCTTSAQFSIGFVNQFPADDNDPWVDIDCSEVVGSWDPNDKQGLPTGYTAAHFIEPGTDIEYLIRFQNTGTDTAFNVVIRDELSPWLDPATVRPGASSHPFIFDFYGDTNIKFTFENIMLPDSNKNQEGSQGFVSFRVSQKAGVPLQTDILNTAAIFFDFNEPVYTNTTTHRVGTDFVSVSAWQPFQNGLDLRVMPNPVAEQAVFEVRGATDHDEWVAELRDATGRSVRINTVHGAQWHFERGNLPAGIYLLQVRAEGRVLGTGKLVLR
ncbi:MAG: hypothetical protein IPH12_16630 [Saprospirales bacterium]|nr:hypothetical protein [Saprospirales bacterium]MBK8920199.1 hypothetical protein [Saprospirales bacterium]